MNKRVTALLLALALVLSVGMVSALADEETAPAAENAAAQAGETAQTAAEEGGEAAEDAAAETPAEEAPVIEIEEAEVNMIMFAELPELVRKNSPAHKALVAQIDFADATEEYSENIGKLVAAKTQEIEALGKEIGTLMTGLYAPGLTAEAKTDLLAQIVAKQLELSGKQAEQMQLQAAMSGFGTAQDTSQMEAGCDQIIMGCETIYINLVNLKMKENSLERQIASLERTQKMMEIRKKDGQISALQMQEMENGLVTARAGLDTLRMNVRDLKMQMEQLIGEDITGTVAVGTLPRVTAEQLDAIDFEKDLQHVLRRNPDVRAAQEADDARWSGAYAGMSEDMREHLFDATDYALENAKLQAEAGFRSLYAQLLDKEQAVVVARGALAVEQLTYDAAALQYERGDSSHYMLLDAEDALQAAKEAVVTAENDLFAAYNQYNWAVKRGVLS